VLLKNDGATLPFSTDAIKNVAVIGPNANLSEAIASYYGGSATCDSGKFWNMVDAVAQYASVTTMLGVPNVRSNDTSSVAAAAAAAAAADQVVMAVGQDGTIEHEGHARVSIALSDGQTTLIKAVAAAAKKPIVVVIMTGGAVDVTDLLANAKVGAVLHVGQPSVTVLGVGDLIFGKYVPAGRMLQTIYPASFADEVSIFDMGMRPGPSDYPRPDCTKPMAQCPNATNPGRTYRFYTGKAVLPFGFVVVAVPFLHCLTFMPASWSHGCSLWPVVRLAVLLAYWPSGCSVCLSICLHASPLGFLSRRPSRWSTVHLSVCLPAAPRPLTSPPPLPLARTGTG